MAAYLQKHADRINYKDEYDISAKLHKHKKKTEAKQCTLACQHPETGCKSKKEIVCYLIGHTYTHIHMHGLYTHRQYTYVCKYILWAPNVKM